MTHASYICPHYMLRLHVQSSFTFPTHHFRYMKVTGYHSQLCITLTTELRRNSISMAKASHYFFIFSSFYVYTSHWKVEAESQWALLVVECNLELKIIVLHFLLLGAVQ